jgi:hypothetical protein
MQCKHKRLGHLPELHGTCCHGRPERIHGRKHEHPGININDAFQWRGAAERIYGPGT